ncbi:MAG: TRAP transporter large permease, partial [Desulfobacterales bacterium]|nr:TRAP transporter large permease [Desulfobacterales bacterium]
AQRMMYGINNFLLLAIPLFILAAKLMNTSGITNRIFAFARDLVGFLPGGLGHANTVASLIFSGMSGAAVVDAAGLGQIELKAMKDAGYDPDFSVAVTAASSTIGPIFPPSIPMVIFGLVAEVSVGRLFLAGVLPGLIMTAALMLMVAWYAVRKGYLRTPFPGWVALAKSFLQAFFPLLTPIILLGGIWTGQFTPTEAAAVAVAYALVLGGLVYREFTLKELYQVFVTTTRETAALGIIVCAANFYGWLLVRSGLTIKLAESISGFGTDPLTILFAINIFLLIVGCFMEPVCAILIMGPVLLTIVTKLGIDPLHFGVIMVLNLMIGLLTPPFGIILFVMAGISGLPFERVVWAVLPFLAPLLLVLILITIFPLLVTAVPTFFFGV